MSGLIFSQTIPPIRVFAVLTLCLGMAHGQAGNFHNAPASARKSKNPYEGQASAQAAGKQLYAVYCSECHGQYAQGSGNIPALASDTLKRVTSGELFWFITKGDARNGMPAWDILSSEKRWQI